MDINIVIILTEKNATEYFNLIFWLKFDYPLWHHKILYCGIENYL